MACWYHCCWMRGGSSPKSNVNSGSASGLPILCMQIKTHKHKYTQINFLFSGLLAPTGALIVMMVNNIYIRSSSKATFSDFHSVQWCNWCYKCHSKSLKQYQCNWCHMMQIDADWMSNVPMFQCSNDPMFKCFNIPMIHCVFLFIWSQDFLV